MRTTLNLDETALKEAMAQSAGRTKTDVVNEALRHYARAKRRRELLAMRGKPGWEGDLGELRKRR